MTEEQVKNFALLAGVCLSALTFLGAVLGGVLAWVDGTRWRKQIGDVNDELREAYDTLTKEVDRLRLARVTDREEFEGQITQKVQELQALQKRLKEMETQHEIDLTRINEKMQAKFSELEKLLEQNKSLVEQERSRVESARRFFVNDLGLSEEQAQLVLDGKLTWVDVRPYILLKINRVDTRPLDPSVVQKFEENQINGISNNP